MILDSTPGVAAEDSVALSLNSSPPLIGLLLEKIIEVSIDIFERGVMVFSMSPVHTAIVLAIAVIHFIDDGTLHAACELDVDSEVFVERECLGVG